MGRRKKSGGINSALTYVQIDMLIASIGAQQRELAMIQTAMSEDLAKIKSGYEDQSAPVLKGINGAMEVIEAWCEAHRAELCPGDAKTYRFPSGEVSWRMRPPRVKIKGAVESAIEWLQHYGPAIFLRHKTELNKEAMLEMPAEAEKIPGVSIARDGEVFSVAPFDAKLSENKQEVA